MLTSSSKLEALRDYESGQSSLNEANIETSREKSVPVSALPAH
jgi:hypothetical protein